MAATTAYRPRIAVLDTNVLIHLAQDWAPALNLVLRLVRLGFTPVVVQTVVQELGYAVDYGETEDLRNAARLALSKMREWGIQPFGLRPVGNGICELVADVIANRGILPDDQRNDAFIAIEAGFCGAAMLVTWDSHLLDAPNASLNEVLKSFDIDPIQIIHPMVILEKE